MLVTRHSSLVTAFILFGWLVPCAAAQDVLTWHNDNARTGQNLQETILTPANVSPSTFGKLFVISVDGKVDAQPLYLSALSIPGQGTHNALYVATENDGVYAFDADTGRILWHVSLLGPGETPSDHRGGCTQVLPQIGITATPVIDRASGPYGTIYVVAMSKNGPLHYFHRLHALDVATGREEFGGPVEVRAAFPGTGDESRDGQVLFNPAQYKERPGLLLVNHTIVTAWSSHCDFRPYTGWVVAYDERTLRQTAVLNLTPNGHEGAIWSSGAAPAADASGNIYLLDGNGTFDTTLTADGFPSRGDYGNAFLKLSLSDRRLSVADYFNMFDTVKESRADQDLGSGGAMVLPDIKLAINLARDLAPSGASAPATTEEKKNATGKVLRLAVGAGKDRNIYLLDRDDMGKFHPDRNAIYQELPKALNGEEFGAPAWFDGRIYYGPVGDSIRAFELTNGKLTEPPVSKTRNSFVYPGTTPSISASGASNGIVWAVESTNHAVLRAYDASDLSRELYNSNLAASHRDRFGEGNKFIVPTIANGKVYVGTTDGVAVFGLLAIAGPSGGPQADGYDGNAEHR
ncbi:MAG: PQQ-binding-like beta-propeller repeat protein [Terriglobia bacterium]